MPNNTVTRASRTLNCFARRQPSASRSEPASGTASALRLQPASPPRRPFQSLAEQPVGFTQPHDSPYETVCVRQPPTIWGRSPSRKRPGWPASTSGKLVPAWQSPRLPLEHTAPRLRCYSRPLLERGVELASPEQALTAIAKQLQEEGWPRPRGGRWEMQSVLVLYEQALAELDRDEPARLRVPGCPARGARSRATSRAASRRANARRRAERKRRRQAASG